MTHSTTQPYGVPVFCLVAVAGCGDPIATGSYRPPYMVLAGTWSVPVAGVVHDGRPASIALLWQNSDGGATYSTTILSEPVEGPGSFMVGVSQRPPAEAIQRIPPGAPNNSGLDPDMRFAVATLIAYRDDNDNGKLDLVDPGVPSPDRILGAASNYDLFFLAQGRQAATQLLGTYPTATDFSLVREPALRDPLPGECDEIDGDVVYAERCHQMEVGNRELVTSMPAGPIELTLSADDPLQRYSCKTFWGDYHDFADWNLDEHAACSGPNGPKCPLDLPPAGAAVHCSDDGTAYVYKTCSENAALCGTKICHFGHGARVPGAPPPAGWPCS